MRAAQAAVELADSILKGFDVFMTDEARRTAAAAKLKPLDATITGKSLPARP